MRERGFEIIIFLPVKQGRWRQGGATVRRGDSDWRSDDNEGTRRLQTQRRGGEAAIGGATMTRGGIDWRLVWTWATGWCHYGCGWSAALKSEEKN
ncbi:hypothetical protein ACOSQ4_009786 [Xanthoceras sorbifolium]